MRIGIDIDDTLTDTWEVARGYYARLLNIPIDKLLWYDSVKNMASLDKINQAMIDMCEEVAAIVKLKGNAKEVINKLRDEGHKIVIITARGEGFTDAYKTTKDYLDKQGIKYDKLIVNSKNKEIDCIKENIDLFIDDSYENCRKVKDKGINTIVYGNSYNQYNKDIIMIDSWLDIYKYITSMGEVYERQNIQEEI